MARQLQLRRGNLSNWNTANPVLANGEFVLVSTNNDSVWNAYKIGNGIAAFNSLPIYEYTGVLGYGSPQGVYTTSAALIAANPNHMYIYIVLADGKWWYWNVAAGAWAAGGLYQTPLSVVQTHGQSEVDVMSQKTVTEILSNTEHALADIVAHLEGRIKTLEELLTASKYNTRQVKELSVVENVKLKGANTKLFGTGAPIITPDFEGQEYLDRTAKIWYDAVGIVNAGDWKPRTNA